MEDVIGSPSFHSFNHSGVLLAVTEIDLDKFDDSGQNN